MASIHSTTGRGGSPAQWGGTMKWPINHHTETTEKTGTRSGPASRESAYGSEGGGVCARRERKASGGGDDVAADLELAGVLGEFAEQVQQDELG